MNIKSTLLLMALSSLSLAQAGERESFDFNWNFKYFGAGDPPAADSPANASSSEPGNEPGNAIDGNEATRWCASGPQPGNSLSINLGKKQKLSKVVILWENGQAKEAIIKFGKTQQKVQVQSEKTEVELKGAEAAELSITVNGTSQGNWASIREITFFDTAGKQIKPKMPKNNAPAESQVAYDMQGFKPVQLPHDWAIESPFLKDEPNETGKLPWKGYGWYRKSFEIPADFSSEKDRYYLDFEGVMACPQIYVNGQKAGEWAFGYNSFRVDITPFIKPGKDNVIAVRANNKALSTRWYPGAGIYRSVWIEKTSAVHIANWGVFVTTPEITAQKATVKIQTEVDNTTGKEATITVQQEVAGIKSKPTKVKLAPHSSQTVEQEIVLPNPRLWDTESPNLYTVKTSVLADGKVIDTKDTRFGVRTVEWKADGFYLNGKRVYLKGVCEHHDLGPLGAAFYKRGMERKIEILKGMGCNSIRTAHNPPAPGLLELADEHGILVMDELFDIWKNQKYDKTNGYHVFWPQWWKKDVENFIKRDRNHPSVIAWSGGNEIDEQGSEAGAQVSTGIKEEMRKYDPTRLYTVGCNFAQAARNSFGKTLEIYGYNYKPSHYAGFVKDRPGVPVYASETSSCVGTRGTYFFPVRWGVGDGARAFQVSAYGLYAPGWGNCPDVEFKGQDMTPEVAGEYVWTGFDYIGEPTPYNQDASNIGNFEGASEEAKQEAMRQLAEMGNKAPSRSSYFGIIDLAGLPKDTYYLYQSRWAPEVKNAHILPHWNWGGREGEVTPVMVFTAGDEAELFINGKSQGVRKKSATEGGTFSQAGVQVGKNEYRFTWEETVYEPGEVKVVVKKDGQPWAEAKRVTSGAADGIRYSLDRPELDGDGRDLAYITLSAVDEKGNFVPTHCGAVEFSIDGPAELIGFCNGNPIDHRSMQDPKQEFFNGHIVAVVRAKRGAAGTATVTVKADGLPTGTQKINVKSIPAKELKKR